MKKGLSRLLWIPALALLAAVLVLVNRPAPAAPAPAPQESLPEDDPAIPLGTQVGERLPDFTVECVDGSVFTLSEQRGKVVVLNLWATWCTPCVRELPNFDRLLQERDGDLVVLAIHASPVTADVPAYLADYDYTMPFAVDGDGSLCALLEASTVLPQTIILDARGLVRYNSEGSLSYEELAALADAALRPSP